MNVHKTNADHLLRREHNHEAFLTGTIVGS